LSTLSGRRFLLFFVVEIGIGTEIDETKKEFDPDPYSDFDYDTESTTSSGLPCARIAVKPL